jgi:hypothetical protein
MSIVASQHRLPILSFVSPAIRPSNRAVAFVFEDDYSLGILQSAVQVAWFRGRSSRLKADPSYTSRSVFNSFPWPQAPAQPAVDRVVEVVSDLLAFRAERTAQGITIGQQYDSLRQPGRSRLRDLHDALDRAVLKVYGFDPDEDLLAQLLALNLSLAELEQAGGAVRAGAARVGQRHPDNLADRTRPPAAMTWRTAASYCESPPTARAVLL